MNAKPVLCREMHDSDRPAVAALLTGGFAAWRDAAFWHQALERLARREPPPGLPRFGYVLEAAGAVVGVLLLIASDRGRRRCNVSSWYVEPDYRLYGTLLVRQALRFKDVTYMNVSPAPETWPVLKAQGYQRYVTGRAVAVPALARGGAGVRVERLGPDLRAGPDLSDAEIALLRDHAGWGCLSVVLHTPSGREPLVFGPRRRRGLGFAYVLYCRDLDSLAQRRLGWFLLRHGILFIVVDADAKLPGMPGRFQDNFPKFYRGGAAPRPGDLADTERAVFGV